MSNVHCRDPAGKVFAVSPQEGFFYQSCIHPQGTEAVFFGGYSGIPRIWRRTLAEGDLEAISPVGWSCRHPVYSWDGEWIAFASTHGSGGPDEDIAHIHASTRNVAADMVFNLFVIRRDGTELRQVTHLDGQNHRPTFSPDGRHLAFASNRAGPVQIWTVPLEGGGEPRNLLPDDWGYRPWYHKSGQSLFYYSGATEEHRIFELNLVTGETSQLREDDQGITHGPFYDPATGSLLAHSTRDGGWGIWEFRLDGTPPSKIEVEGFPTASHPTRSRNGWLCFDCG